MLPNVSKFCKNKSAHFQLATSFCKLLAIFRKNCVWRAVQRSVVYRSRRELSNAYLLAKIGFDTAENELCKVCRCRASSTIRSGPRRPGAPPPRLRLRRLGAPLRRPRRPLSTQAVIFRELFILFDFVLQFQIQVSQSFLRTYLSKRC